MDDHYASLADALETMDRDERARFEDDYARATGVLPGAIAKRLRGGLLSADPAAQAAAATRLAGLEDGLVSVIPENERRRARAIAGFAGLGLPPPRAVELAEEKLAQRVLPTEDLTGGAAPCRGFTTAGRRPHAPRQGLTPGPGQSGSKGRRPLVGMQRGNAPLFVLVRLKRLRR